MPRNCAPWGISGNTVGFTALLELVDIVMDRNGCQTGGKLCAEIYPEAARRMGTSASAVEKSARNAILRGWDRGNRKAWKALFGSADEVCIRPNANNLINQVALDVQRRMRRVSIDK